MAHSHHHDAATSLSEGIHVHATVDHLPHDTSAGARIGIELAADLLSALGAKDGDAVRITTERERSIIARIDATMGPRPESGTARLGRLVRQALKSRLNDAVTLHLIDLRPVKRVELIPAIDVSTAHGLHAHLKSILVENRTPASQGAIVYAPFQGSHAGTTYEMHRVEDGPGYIDEATEILLNVHDSHVPDGAFDVTYEDVGGLGKQIALIRELVQLPLRIPQVYRHLGINPPRGIILYGPPGSGKTHLARAVANEIDARFYYINGPDVIGTYSGETEANLRRMFSEASHHSPSIIFIDELDAMAPKRGESGSQSDVRTVTQLLSLMDGLKRVDSVIVIGTTNRVDAIDTAFRRPGRFDREIFIGPPDVVGRREILEIHTREMPLAESAQTCLDDIAKHTHGFLGADLMELCRDAGLARLRRSASELQDPRVAFKVPIETLAIERQDFEQALERTRPSALRETIVSIPNVDWADIGGLSDVKARLRKIVEMPLRHPHLLAAAGLPAHTGALLYGQAGSGKTLLAKAVATSSGVNFISVDGPEIFNKWLGESEEGIRQIFRIARQVAPAVVFFDQLESIAPIRGRHSGSMTTDRVVSQLLAELDGVEQLPQIAVLGATNRIDLIDPSVLRPGRFGVHIYVDLPDEHGCAEILRIGLRGAQFPNGEGLTRLVEQVAPLLVGLSGAAIRGLCDEAKRTAIEDTGFQAAPPPSIEHLLAAIQVARTSRERQARQKNELDAGEPIASL